MNRNEKQITELRENFDSLWDQYLYLGHSNNGRVETIVMQASIKVELIEICDKLKSYLS